MPFLNLFKKSPKGPIITVRVWINQSEKENGCIKMANEDAKLSFIAWSTLTAQTFQDAFRKKGISNEVILAREVITSRLQGRNFVLLERHYDLDKEIAFLQSLNSKEVLAQVSLSDPIMTAFNGDRIQKVMDTMGHEEGEYIEHKMIDQSIERAMRKIKEGELDGGFSEGLREWMESL